MTPTEKNKMANLLQDDLITLAEAATHIRQKLPKETKLHVSSLYRWARKGVNGRKLEAVTLGNKILTSIAAVERFMSLPPLEKPSDFKGAKAQAVQVEERRNPEAASTALRVKLGPTK